MVQHLSPPSHNMLSTAKPLMCMKNLTVNPDISILHYLVHVLDKHHLCNTDDIFIVPCNSLFFQSKWYLLQCTIITNLSYCVFSLFSFALPLMLFTAFTCSCLSSPFYACKFCLSPHNNWYGVFVNSVTKSLWVVKFSYTINQNKLQM